MSHRFFVLAALQFAALVSPVAAESGYFRVSGVPSNDVLNMRKYPLPSAPQVGALANGDKVRNLGCRSQGNWRWCRVGLTDEMGGQG